MPDGRIVPPMKLYFRESFAVVCCVLSLLGFAFPGECNTAGAPWTGEPGVTETTADIMARSEGYVRPPKLAWKTPKKRPRGRINFENLLDSPNSLESIEEPVGEPQPAGQSSGLSFTGATLFDTLAFPPDSMGAAGPSQFIVAVNGRIRSFNKSTGIADGVLNVNPDVFFQSVMTPPVTNNFTSDPRIRYDRLSGRWFIIIIDVPGQAGALPNRIMIAVSDSGIITPSSVWTFFQFQQDLVAPTHMKDTGKFADYPTLGIDANALYIGVNLFGTRGLGSFDNTTAFVVRKSSLLSGGPIVTTAFRRLVGNGTQGGPYTPQGVDNYDPAATEGYLIGVDSAYYGRLQLRRISNPGGIPSISDDITINVPITGNTINVPHLGNNNGASGYLDGLDFRLIAAHVRNGKLWTAHNIAVDNNGVPNGTDTRMGIRWYELGNLSSAPTVLQSGTLFQPSPSNTTDQRSYWMGSIMVSGQGHALMGFTTAGQNEYANAAYAGRLVNDPAGTLRTPVLYTSSSTSYNPPSNPGGSGGRRWGDYSYTSLDPNDDMTMWTIQEWCNAQNIYAVQVVRVLAPLPATPASCSPAALDQGVNNVDVTLFGSTDGDTGFFDPGAGFSNRIAAAIGGDGVTINNITYNNPTNLTLNLSVAGDATPGSRIITVTNPDGQIVASAGGIVTINGVVPTNAPPVLPAIADQVVIEGNLLTFTNTATDPDLDGLSYSLLAAPAGASVTNNGVFTWTPTESQGPATNFLSMVVTDAGTPSLSVTQTFSVFVLETNAAPSLPTVADQFVVEGTLLQFTNIATDTDIPANLLAYSLMDAPAGAAVTNGIVTWTPNESQGPSTNVLSMIVTDDGVPSLSSTQTFSIYVLETNNFAPSFPSIADRTIHAATTLPFTNIASDSDVPANNVSFSLDPGGPPTASVGASDGVFSWTPVDADAGTTNAITIRATDDGVPILDGTQTFSVIVVGRPFIQSITLSNNLPILDWSSISGQTYRLQYTPLLDGSAWSNLVGDVTASGNVSSKADPETATTNRFYRVQALP